MSSWLRAAAIALLLELFLAATFATSRPRLAMAATQRSSAARIGSMSSNSASRIGTCPSVAESISMSRTTPPAVSETVRS